MVRFRIMNYLSPNDIKFISIDHTSKCNLACPQCARTNNNLLPMSDLTVDDYKSFITPITSTLRGLFYCGNYGDAIASNTLMPILEWLYLDSEFTGKVDIVTNGSLRDKKWWTKLATLIGNRGSIRFSIDGLGETNHIYRVNSNFDKIIENASAYLGAGGVAHWDFLVFKHNEHEIDQAQDLARTLGFSTFKIKQTNRFMSYHDASAKGTSWPDNTVAMTTVEQFQGMVKTNLGNILEKHGSWANYSDSCQITCKAKADYRLFIDFNARIWPCTWTAGGLYYTGKNDVQRADALRILDKYGTNFNSLRHFSLEEILQHEYYATDLNASWSSTSGSINPKLEACVRFCGNELETSSGWGSPNNKNNEVFQLQQPI